jgi:hypothetical protein
MDCAFNKMSDDLLQLVLQRQDLKRDSLAYINAEWRADKSMSDLYVFSSDMWARIRMCVLRMFKTFKHMYATEFGKSGMKHVKGNIMDDTFDNVIVSLNSYAAAYGFQQFVIRVPHPPLNDRHLGVYYFRWIEGGHLDISDFMFYQHTVEMSQEVEVMSSEELVLELEALRALSRNLKPSLVSMATLCLKKARVAKRLLDDKFARKRLKSIKRIERLRMRQTFTAGV